MRFRPDRRPSTRQVAREAWRSEPPAERLGLLYSVFEDPDEAVAFCSLYCVWILQSKRTAACVAAIAGTYADTDMAGSGSRSAACTGAREHGDVGKRFSSWRPTGSRSEQRDTADDHSLFSAGQKYRRRGGRVSRRGLSDACH